MSLPESWVRIGGNQYPSTGAETVCSADNDGVSMELYSFAPLSASQKLFINHGGMTINGVLWPGASDVPALVGRTLTLTPDDAPELAESVFWEQGRMLEIARLELRCLELTDSTLRVSVQATLLDADSGLEIPAEALLDAALFMQ